MAQDSESGYVCCLHVNRTNIYKFSYTRQDPERRIQQVKREHKDLSIGKYYCIQVSNIKNAENYFSSKLKPKEYKGKGYGGRENFYQFPEGMSTQDVFDLINKHTSTKTGENSTSNNPESGGWGILILIFIVISIFSALHSDDEHQKCVNNGGGNACENIKK